MNKSDTNETDPNEASEVERCRAAALRILNYRWNSETELRRKLDRKGFSTESVAAVLAQLTAEKWLDDERFAAAFTRDRARRSLGSRRIARELGAAGVDAETVQNVVRSVVEPDVERAALVALCRKKMKMIARRSGPEAPGSDAGRKKLTAYLLNQGYEMAAVLDVIRECLKEAVVSD
jgi:regulatory protein